MLERFARLVIPEGKRTVVTWFERVVNFQLPVFRGFVNVPPEKSTPSSLTLSVLIMASCPGKLKTNVPSGHFHFLMLND